MALLTAFNLSDPEQLGEAASLSGEAPVVCKLHPSRAFRAGIRASASPRTALMIIRASNIAVNTPASARRTGGTAVNVPLSGTFQTDNGVFSADFIPHSADVTLDENPFWLHSERTDTMVAYVDNSLLKATYEELTGNRFSSDLIFDGVLDLRSPSGRSFFHDLRLLWGVDTQDEASDSSRVDVLEHELASDLLLSLGADNHPALVDLQDAASPQALARAEEWILERLTEPITRADLCAVSGLHVRTLSRAFTQKHGVGPMQFVRDQRLDAIHQVLVRCRPEETSVTQVAEDFGLSHLGRFAQAYRQRFKERPSETLKR